MFSLIISVGGLTLGAVTLTYIVLNKTGVIG